MCRADSTSSQKMTNINIVFLREARCLAPQIGFRRGKILKSGVQFVEKERGAASVMGGAFLPRVPNIG
jgi:hypothetical protein